MVKARETCSAPRLFSPSQGGCEPQVKVKVKSQGGAQATALSLADSQSPGGG